MAGLLKASSIIQPAYLSPHRKRRNPLPLLLCKTHNRERRLDTLGLKCVDGNITNRRPLRMIRKCRVYTNHLRPACFARPEDWVTSLNLGITSVPQLASAFKAMPTESPGISSAPLIESTVPVMTHPLLNFLLEAYSSFHEQALVAPIILAAIVVVATFVARFADERRVEKSLVFVSRPSQFNRFVSMRCPSISTNLSAKIQVLERTDLEYQRMCLHAPDGGIAAIDWPAELDFFAEESHLANTLLLVPGTTEGSEDEGVKRFVIDAMRYGYFPVVLNPRGCASSPVTTPRVFSGADSDDVRLAVQHIVSQRPGSSLMGVGWGWGANMLTKYLGEEAGSTSLMAAVAISNPFDLQQSSMYLGMTNAGQLDRVMAKGLVNILKENKVLFVGQNKGFDLESALASTSIRDFDTAISRMTHGFDNLEEFYSAASSARYISSVQVPLLSIQGEDFSMPVTSIPYSILEANPYTTALVAQVPSSNASSVKAVVREPGSASRHGWSHTVAFEWLAAVEVALLKGHHPLINAVSSYDSVSVESEGRVQPSLPMDVSTEGNGISRSRKDSKMDTSVEALKDEKKFEDENEDKSMQGERLSVAAINDEAGGNEEVEENDAAEITKKQDSISEAESIPSEMESTSQEAEIISSKMESTPQEAESTPAEAKSTSPEEESTSPEPPSPPPEEGEPEEAAEAIQMRDAAESVMNVLDITMPGTLSDEKKEQVLTAVGEGESILTALQEAVPEEVRGSLTAAVSGAVEARGLNFNLVGFSKNIPPPRLPAGLIDSIKGRITGGKKESTLTPPILPGDGSISGGTGDTNGTQSASSQKADDRGHADPVNVASDVGTENNVVKQEDKSQSSGENQSKKDSSKDSKEPKSEEPKDSTESKSSGEKQEEPKSDERKESTESKPVERKQEEPKFDEPKESTESKPVGGKQEEPKSDERKESTESKPVERKQEEPVDKHEEVEQTENKKKDGAQEAPVGDVAPKDDEKPDDTGDSNGSTNAKGETKPAEVHPPSPDTPVLAAAAASPPPAPGLENSTSPTPPQTGVAPPLDMGLAFQALTGFDDSTQIAVTNVFGVVENMLEKMEQEQVASANAKETSDDQENNNGKGNDKKIDDRKVVDDSPRDSPPEKDGASRDSKPVADIGLYNTDGGDDDGNTHETANSKKRETVEEADKKQEENKKGKEKAMSVPEQPKQVKKNSVNICSSNEGLGKRLQSKVMMIQRVGNSTLVEPMLKDQPLKTHFPPSVNGALSKDNGASFKQKDSETQQSTQLVEEANNSMKPVVSKRTIEQLSQEVDQEKMKERDDSSVKVNDQNIEAEVTEIKEKENPNMIEDMVKNALKLEVVRRLGVAGMESLGIDLEQEVAKVANSVAEAVQRWKKDPSSTDGLSAGKLGILSSNSVTSTLGTIMSGNQILGGLLPVGVLAGVILASLGAVYLIVTDNQQDDGENDDERDMAGDKEENESDNDSDSDPSLSQRVKAPAMDVPVLNGFSELGKDSEMEAAEDAEDDIADEDGEDSESEGSSEKDERKGRKQAQIMGMMAAAVTGGATLAGMSNQDNGAGKQDGQNTGDSGKELAKGSVISSLQPLAEKALTVAAPVVPHTEDGEIDHERLVAMLAELGQRGGFLRLIGKVALLWGGLRGAMSLTDRLLVYLQMNKRPLHLRLVGFAAMVVLLWSPVLIPVLPSLLQQWATKAPGGVAEAASAVGLYVAALILVTIWGKRVRGYNKPLLHYGIRLWSKRKAQDLGLGVALGGGLVSFLYITNFILGYVQFSWVALLATNPKLPGTVGVALFTAAKLTKLVGQAVAIGLAVALVEEVLFRAWLQEEIAVDLGFHRAVFISAVAFALVHWSPAAMPGLWFFSVTLAGARAKMNRNLAFPIGLHAGLVSINYVMTAGGLVQYLPHAPTWFTGAHVGNPLAGALGTAIMALLAVVLYPRTAIHPLPASKELEHAV